MKICFLNKNLDTKTGIGRYGREIVENITKQKNIQAVVLVEEKSGYKLEKAVLKRAYLLRNLPNLFINTVKVRKYIKNCDVVHALDGYPYGAIAVLANIGIGK